MEDLLRPIYQERASNQYTLGVLFLEKDKPNSPLTDQFDAILIVITKDESISWDIKHYEFKGKKAALHIVSKERLTEWLIQGEYGRLLSWLLNCKVLFERNEYVTDLRSKLKGFPIDERKKRIGIEFAMLIRCYYNGKDLFDSNQNLDAYNQMIRALHHLARLSVIQHGFHPEITVWKQVRQIEPEVYKLYQELIESKESIEKRLELLFIASGFAISARIKIGGAHLLDVMVEKEVPWAYEELKNHEDLKEYGLDLNLLLEHLIEKKKIKPIKEESKGKHIFHRKYIVEN